MTAPEAGYADPNAYANASPSPSPAPPQTGNARIDDALGTLAAAGDAPPDELVAPLTEADRALRETLDAVGDD